MSISMHELLGECDTNEKVYKSIKVERMWG